MPIVSIPTKARDGMIALCKQIHEKRNAGDENMADFFERRLEGYRQAVRDICGSVVSGILIMETDPVLYGEEPEECLPRLEIKLTDGKQ